ncbi:MAG: hypothetical protein JSW01_04435 [Candidatus Bathyarchaeota archaeon]|nr:MAG: hypothetical protein JSW01_04435 [Candidatus Bathyarchaeota archaeon]
MSFISYLSELKRRIQHPFRNYDILGFDITKMITPGGIPRVAYTFIIVFSASAFFLFFPHSLFAIFWIPFLATFGLLVYFFDYPGALPPIRGNVRARERFERNSKKIFYSLVVVTGYWIGIANFGTLASTILIAAVSLLACGNVFFYALEGFEERNELSQGYSPKNGMWRVEVQKKNGITFYYLNLDETPVPISKREAKLLIHLSKYSEKKKLLNFKFLVRRLHSLKTGFQRGDWTVDPSAEPGTYTLYKKNLENIITISKRDAFWLLLSPRNTPEILIQKIRNMMPRRKPLQDITCHLKNVTFAGTNAVIHTSRGEIYVEIDNGRVFRDTDWDIWDWEMKEGGFVCIIPKFPREKDFYYYSRDSPIRRKISIDQPDAIVLSKILNIANETTAIKNLLDK